MTDDQIKHMVDRFLGWRLPENFNPDAGISFTRTFNEHLPQPMKHEPIGTNLFDAQQAEQMVRYMVEEMPCRPNPETQAVAWVLLNEHGPATSTLDPLIKMAHESDGGRTEPLFRSPVEAVPVSALRELEAEWRAEAELHPLKTLAPGGECPALALEKCADHLSAVIRGTKT